MFYLCSLFRRDLAGLRRRSAALPQRSKTKASRMAMVEERPLFENEDWAVVDSGLEHKRTGYFIEREVIAQRRSDGLWLWPLHVAEKSWCRMTTFTEAFSCAATAYGVR